MTRLSNNLISQFVKITNDAKNKPKTESTAYGTIVLYEDKKYVKLDGSDLLTPISTTSAIDDGERVMVTIKNHAATVTGNLSEPSAKDSTVDEIGDQITEFEIAIGDKVSTKDFDAQVGRINTLVSDNVLIKETLTAHEGTFETLTTNDITINDTLTAHKALIDELEVSKIDASLVEADFIEVNGKIDATRGEFNDLQSNYATFESTVTSRLEAQDAIIKDLDVGGLTAEEADLKYAKIDFTNIGEAAIEYFYATSGLIKDVQIDNGVITGNLVGVTIKGDLIEGGTVVADKLVIQGEDGLYYKLNTDGMKVETEQTEYNSINGSVILAKSITATKIAVEDLVAFGATIGGFHITDDSLYSGVKNAIDSPAEGVYLNKYGELNFGGNDSYIKYYKDAEGNYHLAISADSIKISTSNTTIEEMVAETNDRLIETELSLTQVGILDARVDGITASVTEIKTSQESTDEALEAINRDILTLTNSVEAKLSAEDIQILIQNQIETNVTEVTTTTGFTFNQDGLTISKTGREMATTIDEDGVVIKRDDEERLIANNEGVIAYNLQAKTYLIVGENSRLEDYEKNGIPQTGCFWIGDTEV